MTYYISETFVRICLFKVKRKKKERKTLYAKPTHKSKRAANKLIISQFVSVPALRKRPTEPNKLNEA